MISGNENLKEGNNIITITVTAPNGISKREYKIIAHMRTNNEQQQYEQEQDEQKEVLEEAYELEKISNINEENPVIQMEQEKNKYILVIVTSGVIIAVIVIAFLMYKKRHFRKK